MAGEAQREVGIDAATPAAVAAQHALRERLRRVGKLLARSPEAADEGRHARRVRIATRRAEAALAAFRPWLDRREAARAKRTLRRIRRSASAARDAELHAGLLGELDGRAGGDLGPALEHLRGRIALDRERAAAELARAGRQRKRLRRIARKLVRGGGDRGKAGRVVACSEAAAARLLPLARAVRRAEKRDLSDLANLHRLRIRVKRFRYALEVFDGCVPREGTEALAARVRALQKVLGAVNDIDSVIARLERDVRELGAQGEDAAGLPAGATAADVRRGIATLLGRYVAVRGRRHAEALERIGEFRAGALVEALETLALRGDERAERGRAAADAAARNGALPAGRAVEADGVAGNGEVVAGSAHPASGRPASAGPRRVAAIDVGTNSIRLLVAEVHPDGTYRAVGDERDPARIGRSVARTGRFSDGAMIRASEAVARMVRVASEMGVAMVRVVGTSAVRDAENRDELIRLVRERCGHRLEVISAEDEGRLAYASAAHAFDLGSVAAAVADVGGGSTQVVLAAGGVTDRIYTLALGAVRLTEMFGGPEEASGRRYKAMREHIREQMRREIGRTPVAAQVLIGTGGTFTTLANILAAREAGPGGAGAPALPWRGAPGHEVLRSEARHLLDHLRGMPVGERTAVPGLPAERADIFVAGLTIVDCLMRQLGVNAVRIHERGIRDGLVLAMARRIYGPPPGAGPDPVRAARRLAEACRYERSHSEHVTRLALRIFDQLAAQAGREGDGWSGPRARRLLEAAAVLHDAGYLIDYAQHHKHSYHLIVHADLPGFSRREVAIVANVAGYHRRAEPGSSHAGYAALDREDRAIVRRLAGILRVADGLDRTHTQNVRDAALRVRDGRAVLAIESAEDPAADVRGSRRKSRLFERAFGVRLTYERAGDAAGGRAAADRAAVAIPVEPD